MSKRATEFERPRSEERILLGFVILLIELISESVQS
jgi:hypothetical protein